MLGCGSFIGWVGVVMCLCFLGILFCLFYVVGLVRLLCAVYNDYCVFMKLIVFA